MNKIVKIILISLGILVILFGAVELLSMKIIINKHDELIRRNHPDAKITYEHMQKRNFEELNIPMIYKGSSKELPIIFFGCGFTEGFGLKFEQTLPYKFNQLTGLTTYNYAIGGSGAQHMLYMLREDDVYKKLRKPLPNNQMLVYTFEPDHYRRNFSPIVVAFSTTLEPYYRFKNGKLVPIQPIIPSSYSLFVRKLAVDIMKYKPNTQNHNIELFYAMLKESYDIAKKKFPDSKFVILLYENFPCEDIDCVTLNQTKKLEEMGFIVINLSELVGHDLLRSQEYLLNNGHPNEAAWDLIVPALIKKLKLK